MTAYFKDVIEKLLHIDLMTIAHRLGFSNTLPNKLSFDDVCEAIKSLNQLSLMESEADRNAFITIAALLWEYAHSDYPNLRDILILLLSRIGYALSSIILDSNYSKDGKYEALHSLISQITTTINQQRYEIKIGKHCEMLTAFQLSVSNSIRENKLTGISAPTSAGKSYVLLIEAARAVVENKWDVIYIIPTISLINQVTTDFSKYFRKIGASDIEVFNSYNPELVTADKPHVFVLTQERVAAAFTMRENPFSRKAFLIIDEIQNIERISNDSEMRSKVLLDTVHEFRFLKSIEKIVVSGPRISKIGKLCKDLLDEDCADKTTNISPVLNLTYSINKMKNEYHFRQYCSLLDAPNFILIQNPSLIEGHGKKRYTIDFLLYLSRFIDHLGANVQNVIFTPNPATARKTAMKLAEQRQKNNGKELDLLVAYLKESVNVNYALADVVSKGIAYHHGNLPQHVRKVIEYAISKKLISNVVCTTTLMQGVNMPAQNIIIRNPHLYINAREGATELSSYDMANLRGRAGRLLKDFIGRSFVLDENEFLKMSAEYSQGNLFEDTEKELDSSYRSTYNQYADEISKAVTNKTLSTQLPSGYAFIVTYIRQAILRHGRDAINRLERIGISISEAEFAVYKSVLSALQVPREICLRNRYSDPEIMNLLYTDNSVPNLPTDVTRGAESKLGEVLKYLHANANYSSLLKGRIPDHYQEDRLLKVFCSMSIKWAKQIPLKIILENSYFDTSDKVEDAVKLLQNTISYDLPMLLKPLYDVKNVEPTFITFLESGANMPITRKLIEIGIPRETAIFLFDHYFSTMQFSPEDVYSRIIAKIRANQRDMPFWIEVQLRMFFESVA